MAQKFITVTGRFLDVSGEPLKGTVVATPAPRFIAEDIENIYSGPVTGTLDETGALMLKLLATTGWRYSFRFNLETQAGRAAGIDDYFFEIPADTTVPHLMEATYSTGSTRPVIRFTSTPDGDIQVSGATVSPEDPGALIIPIS